MNAFNVIIQLGRKQERKFEWWEGNKDGQKWYGGKRKTEQNSMSGKKREMDGRQELSTAARLKKKKKKFPPAQARQHGRKRQFGSGHATKRAR